MKKQLAYSSLTDTVYYIDGRGQKIEIPKGNFTQMVLLWLNKGVVPEVGTTVSTNLSVNGKVHWEITCKRIAK